MGAVIPHTVRDTFESDMLGHARWLVRLCGRLATVTTATCCFLNNSFLGSVHHSVAIYSCFMC